MPSMTSMPAPFADALKWLAGQIQEQHLPVQIHDELVRPEEGWLYVPAYVSSTTDSYEKAELLQTLEDRWNNQQPRPKVRMLLVPTKD